MEDYLISMAASIVLRLLENPTSRSKYRRLFLKLFRAIAAGFIEDPELQATAKQVGRG